jgi:hypothetical protein
VPEAVLIHDAESCLKLALGACFNIPPIGMGLSGQDSLRSGDVARKTGSERHQGLDGSRIPAEMMHHVGLVELRGEFATIRTTD